MTAYVIVDIHVNDPVGFEEYKNLASSTLELYGGKYCRGSCDTKLQPVIWW